jgi:predicted GNAT family acetyltransferase
VAQSILFSNNDSASRTYEALRYQHIGQYRVALLKAPIRTGDKP